MPREEAPGERQSRAVWRAAWSTLVNFPILGPQVKICSPPSQESWIWGQLDVRGGLRKTLLFQK